MNRVCGIYKITNKINGKCYIGQSVNIYKRWIAHKNIPFKENSHGYNYCLSRAIRKYGIENFRFEIIEKCSPEDLNEKEIFYIHKYDSFHHGYNSTLGGDGSANKAGKDPELIKSIVKELETTDLTHKKIAEKYHVSTELVQGINTGRYWFDKYKSYPLQNRCKLRNITLSRTEEEKSTFCPKCGNKMYKSSKMCLDCWKEEITKEKPSKEKLKTLIYNMPFTQIGEMYNVSGNSIKKWCKKYGLPHRKKDIKKEKDNMLGHKQDD